MSASYQAIKRNGDFGVSLGNSVPVQPNAVITDDFLEVDFLLKNGTHVKEFFLQVVPRDDLLKRQATNKGPGLPLNILIICIDSLSHASARRKLPKIYDFLQHEVDAFIFNGHTVVGDGTTEQMTALLTGLKFSEQYEGRAGFKNARPLDEWTWIYKQLTGECLIDNDFYYMTQATSGEVACSHWLRRVTCRSVSFRIGPVRMNNERKL